MSRHERTQDQKFPETVLDALLAQEANAAERLERARAEAASVLAATRKEIATVAEQSRAALEADLAALEALHTKTLADIERDVVQSSTATVSQYRNIGTDDVERLAAQVLGELLNPDNPGAP